MEMKFTDDNFENEVLKSDKPCLVDFFATWCGPCKTMGPIIEEIANEYDGKVKVGKLDIDENPNMVSKYQIMSVPTMIVFKNGEPVKTFVGLTEKEDIVKEF